MPASFNGKNQELAGVARSHWMFIQPEINLPNPQLWPVRRAAS